MEGPAGTGCNWCQSDVASRQGGSPGPAAAEAAHVLQMVAVKQLKPEVLVNEAELDSFIAEVDGAWRKPNF